MNLTTIATNIATRFSSSTITPPSGYPNVKFATHILPNAIPVTPCVLVKPPVINTEYGPGGMRVGTMEFPVEFYIAPSAEDNAQALYDWWGVLFDQLIADYDIGAPTDVVDATITESRLGTLVYAGQDYVGIVFTVRVRIVSGYNATT